MKIEPRYNHDCMACTFLGYYHEYDLYYCPKQMIGGETVIAHCSDEGSDYLSGIGFASPYVDEAGEVHAACDPLKEALHRVIVSDLRILIEEAAA